MSYRIHVLYAFGVILVIISIIIIITAVTFIYIVICNIRRRMHAESCTSSLHDYAVNPALSIIVARILMTFVCV